MRYRWLLSGVALLFLVSNVYGASFGTFPYQIEKQSSDLEINYRIGFINPSSDPIEVTLSSSDAEEYNLTFSQNKFRIPPGTTDDPSGSGWYHLGGGEYAKIHEKTFQVDVSRYREDNRLSFPVTIEAVSIGESQNEGSQSKLVQIRNYNYRAQIDPNLRPEERPEQDSGSSWRDNFWQESNSDPEEDFNLKQDKSSNQEDQQNDQSQQENQTGVNKLGQERESNSKKPLINKTTLALILGIIVSLAYIFTEV